jgi:glutaredoxin
MDNARRTHAVLLAAALGLPCLALAPIQAEVYKWKDAQGVLHFSDRPPGDGKADRVQLPPANSYPSPPAEVAPAERAQAKRPAKARSVVMFSAQWCGYCRKARDYFQSSGVAFRERDIEKDAAARAEYDRLGGTGVPLILVGDRRLNGFSEDSFRRLYGH